MENLLSSAQPFGRLVDILEESASCHCYNFLVVVSPCPLRESAVIDTIFPVVFLTLLKNHLSSIRRFGRLVGSFGQPSVIDTQPSISWRIGCHLYKLPCRLVDTLGELAVIDTTFRSSCWHSWKINSHPYNFPIVLLTLLENQASSLQLSSRLVDTLGESSVILTTFQSSCWHSCRISCHRPTHSMVLLT